MIVFLLRMFTTMHKKEKMTEEQIKKYIENMEKIGKE